MSSVKRRPGLAQRTGPVAAASVPADARSRSTASITSSVHSRPAPQPSTSTPQQPITLTKRLLFPQLPQDAPIPPIFQSPGLPPSLDTEVYDFLALALRAFINPWWTKITRYDKEFLVQVTSIITVVLRNLESRSLAADLSPTIFRDLPTILTQHYVDYRSAKQRLNTSYSLAGASSFQALFHAQQQHIGVTANGELDEVYVRTAIDAVLKACLPPEDWEAESERYIVREIVVRIVTKDVAGKLTQPWFMHKLILDMLGPPPVIPVEPPGSLSPSTATSSYHLPSMHTIIVFFLSAIQSISSIALALINSYKHAMHGIQVVNHHHTLRHPLMPSSSKNLPSDSPPVSSTSPHATPPYSLPITSIPKEQPTNLHRHPSDSSPAFPGADKPTTYPDLSSEPTDPAVMPPTRLSPPPPPHYPLPAALTRPHPPPTDLARAPVALFTEMLTLRRRHASSGLASLLDMLQAGFAPFLDRLLPYVLYEHVLSPGQLTSMVIIAKRALFPNGYPASAPPDPTPEEQVAMKEALVDRIMAKVPSLVGPVILGPTVAEQRRTIEELIEPLSNQACNAHLLVCILDCLLLALFPELGGEEDSRVGTVDPRDAFGRSTSTSGLSGVSAEGVGLGLGMDGPGGEARSVGGGSVNEKGRGVKGPESVFSV